MNIKGLSKYKIIVKNTGYLSILEVLKLAMPFIALPYIIRIVGGENYGLIAFVQTVVSYFSIIINFGLDVSAVKDVAILRNDKEQLSQLVSSVLCIKFFLWIFSSFILITCCLVFDVFRSNVLLIFFAYLSCFSDILFPVWYFQGIERMKYITFVRFFSILFYTISIFIFIHSSDDYIFIPLLQSLGMLLSGFISIYLLLVVEKIHLSFVSYSNMKAYFLASIPFFISRLSLLINAGIAKIICGIFFSMQSVAAFDIAQKIANVAFIPLQMINQSVYPHLARIRDRQFARKCFGFMCVCSSVVTLFIYIFAPLGIAFFAGEELTEAVGILRILCVFVFCGGISLYLGTPLLVAFGYSRPFNVSVIGSTFVLIVIYLLLYYLDLFTVQTFALVLGITELFIVLYRLYYCLKYKILYYNAT